MLETNRPKVELGRIRFGKSTKFSYIVTNTGTKDLNIDKLVLGCGSCTTATANKTTLKPAEKATIDVTFTPGSTGIQTKHLDVKYDGGKFLTLKFTANVYG